MNLLELIGSVALPTVAMIISCVTFYYTNRMNKKVNRKDYEISENLKYELLKLIAVLKSIDAKAVLSSHFSNKMDYTMEMKAVTNLKLSPGFLLFMHAVKSDEDRFWLDLNIQLFTINGNQMSKQQLRKFSARVMAILENGTNLADVLDMEVMGLMNDLCHMHGAIPAYEEDTTMEKNNDNSFNLLIKRLYDQGCEDPDVLMFYAVIFDSESTDLLKKALDNGADTSTTDKDIIGRYRAVYEEVLSGK